MKHQRWINIYRGDDWSIWVHSHTFETRELAIENVEKYGRPRNQYPPGPKYIATVPIEWEEEDRVPWNQRSPGNCSEKKSI